MEVIDLKSRYKDLYKHDLSKVQIIKECLPINQSTFVHAVDWEFLDIPIKMHFRSEAPAVFCEDYYKPFSANRPSVAETNVYLIEGKGDHFKIDHPLWWNPEPEAWLIPQNNCDEPGFIVIQRDFVAWVSDNFQTVIVVTPEISIKTTDSLDNLFSILFSQRGLEVGALPVHSAMVEKGGQAFVFFGDSGAGKSTLADQCFHNEGLRVLATDQGFIKYENGSLVAQASSRKNPELPRADSRFCTDKMPVGGLIHLVQRGDFEKLQLSETDFFKLFLKQTLIYQLPINEQKQFLDLCGKALSCIDFKCQLSYPQGQQFWELLLGSSEGEISVTR